MSVRSLLRPFSKRLDRLQQRVVHFRLSHSCPICRSRLRHFLPYGVVPRPNARCPVCGALERHRLLWLFFTTQTNLMHPTPKRMLHVAPERAFTTQLKRIPGLDYLTADLYNPRAMVKMDITDIQYPDASFDVIYCSHVLEHVPDDRKAMREFFRVLKPTGWAVLQVPITADHTIEDPSVVEPEERERLFGQKDHVRRYGPDYTQRLEEAGFTVKCIPASAVGDERQRRELGILDDESIYYCTRSA
jgi:hypothetical protein